MDRPENCGLKKWDISFLNLQKTAFDISIEIRNLGVIVTEVYIVCFLKLKYR